MIVDKLEVNSKIKTLLNSIGLTVELESGHLHTLPSYKPLNLAAEIVFIRHGETFGNCGQTTQDGQIAHQLVTAGIKDKMKRIYQGNVDTEINQLTSMGKEQALQVAKELENKFLQRGWIPDIILHSPLTRAFATGVPFVERNHFYDRYTVDSGIKEMSYGAWDNRRICDLEESNRCHLIYKTQHTLVKQSGINGNGQYQTAENFCEVLLRAYHFYKQFAAKYNCQRAILFSHSMFGAASMILFGRGQLAENANYFAFDGKRCDGTEYIMPNAQPFLLNY